MLRKRALVGFSSMLLTLGVLSSSPATSQERPIMLHPKGLNAVVAVAALEAHRRLGDPSCRQIFSEFRDASGVSLQERLDAIGQTGESYLGWLRFVDGGVGGRCERPEVVAFTSPGSQVVRFCGDRFTRAALAARGPGFLAAIVIHEELHSLGLGENPPTSDEITRRVEARCGS
jgi:hypothetical protein